MSDRGHELAKPVAPGFFFIPSIVTDTLMYELADTELRLLLLVLRQTAGFRDPQTGRRKVRDWISQSQFMRGIGRSEGPVARGLASLVSKSLIIAEDESGQPLATPAARRRNRGRIYYRIGPALSASLPGDLPEPIPSSKSVPSPEPTIPYAVRSRVYALQPISNAEGRMQKGHMTKQKDKKISRMHFPHSALSQGIEEEEMNEKGKDEDGKPERTRTDEIKQEIQERLSRL